MMEDSTMGHEGHVHIDMNNSGEVETLRSKVRKAMAGIGLRYALYMLTSGDVDNDGRAALIYDALAHATHLGYKCGIDMYGNWVGAEEMYAVIELPTGTIGFALSDYEGTDFMYEPDLVNPIVDAFIGEEGYGQR
jgi:hypothetical protein